MWILWISIRIRIRIRNTGCIVPRKVLFYYDACEKNELNR
jgi:hypothetical protein